MPTLIESSFRIPDIWRHTTRIIIAMAFKNWMKEKLSARPRVKQDQPVGVQAYTGCFGNSQQYLARAFFFDSSIILVACLVPQACVFDWKRQRTQPNSCKALNMDFFTCSRVTSDTYIWWWISRHRYRSSALRIWEHIMTIQECMMRFVTFIEKIDADVPRKTRGRHSFFWLSHNIVVVMISKIVVRIIRLFRPEGIEQQKKFHIESIAFFFKWSLLCRTFIVWTFQAVRIIMLDERKEVYAQNWRVIVSTRQLEPTKWAFGLVRRTAKYWIPYFVKRRLSNWRCKALVI